MAFYAGRVVLHPAMMNQTIVVTTDRNDLDDQLFGKFALCPDLLQPLVQAADRADLRAKLAVAAGGIAFTTIQKFFPEDDRHPVLSERSKIADEAHRSQYDFIDVFARHMRDALPNASFVGFPGTPIEQTDANTRAVFDRRSESPAQPELREELNQKFDEQHDPKMKPVTRSRNYSSSGT
jgi:type I restriction enzyme R subunit